MKVALVHDYLTQIGGAERVLKELTGLFPDAPIFTLLYDERSTRGMFQDKEIITSSLQRVPFARKHHRVFPMVMPHAAEAFTFEGFDVVISDSTSFAKGVIVPPHVSHISFCHTPPRYAWDDSRRYVGEFHALPRLLRFVAPLALTYLRLWDYAAAQRPDALLANSAHVKRRIRKYYGRDAAVVYPPVRTSYFADVARNPQGHFLMVGRLLAYKRFDLGMKAAKEAGVPLRIVGHGPEYKNLRSMADSSVTFLGAISDQELKEEFASCRALLFPQEEDFGIVAVEAMAAGVPVIAYGFGGARETVVHGTTGVLVSRQEPAAFAQALREFRRQRFDPPAIRAHARTFDAERFRAKIMKTVNGKMETRMKKEKVRSPAARDD